MQGTSGKHLPGPFASLRALHVQMLYAGLSKPKQRQTTGKFGPSCARQDGRSVRGSEGLDALGSVKLEDESPFWSTGNLENCPE